MTAAYISENGASRLRMSQWAEGLGIHLCECTYADPPPDGQYDPVLYDLNSVPEARREAVLSRLKYQALSHSAAVLAIDLSDDEAASLLANGVVVFRNGCESRLAEFFGVRAAGLDDRTCEKKNATRLVIGAACRDDIIRYRRRVGVSKQDILSRTEGIGGAGANVSRGHRALAPDRRIALIAPVGDDAEGRLIREELGRLGIEMPWLPVPGARTSLSLVLLEKTFHIAEILCDTGARCQPIPLELVEQQAPRAEALCLAHLGVNGQISDLLKIARRYGVPACFGLGRTQLSLGYEGLCGLFVDPVELFISNRVEAEMLTGTSDIPGQLKALHFGGRVRIAVLTDGIGGIYGHVEGKPWHVPAYHDPSRKVIDDCGAGDAAQAAIEDALLRGYPLEAALAAGARQGFEVCTGTGAAERLLGRQQMDEYLRQNCVLSRPLVSVAAQ